MRDALTQYVRVKGAVLSSLENVVILEITVSTYAAVRLL